MVSVFADIENEKSFHMLKKKITSIFEVIINSRIIDPDFSISKLYFIFES